MKMVLMERFAGMQNKYSTLLWQPVCSYIEKKKKFRLSENGFTIMAHA